MMTNSSVIGHLFELSSRAGNLISNEGHDSNLIGESLIMEHGRRNLRETNGEPNLVFLLLFVYF